MKTTDRARSRASLGALGIVLLASTACSGGTTAALPPGAAGARGIQTGVIADRGGSPPAPPLPGLDLKALCAFGVTAADIRLDNGPESVRGDVALTAFPPGHRFGDRGRARFNDGSTVSGSLTILGSDVEVETTDGSRIAHGIAVDANALGRVLASELERSAALASLSATLDPATIPGLTGAPQTGPVPLPAIRIALKAGINVLDVGDFALRERDVQVVGPPGASLVINASGRIELEAVNLIVGGGMDARQVVLNAVRTADSSDDVRIKGGEGGPARFGASLLAAHSRVRIESTVVNGIVASGDELEIRDGSAVSGQCPAGSSS